MRNRSAGLIEHLGEPGQLPFAKPSRCHERSGRHPARQRDQRHIAAPAQERGSAARRRRRSCSRPSNSAGDRFDAADIDVVIAGYDRDVTGLPTFRAMRARAGIPRAARN